MAEMLDEEHLAVKCIVLINSCTQRNYLACVLGEKKSGEGVFRPGSD